MKEKRKENNNKDVPIWFIGLFFIIFGIMIGGIIIGLTIDISLSQETADDICQQLTNDSSVVASNTHDGKWTDKLVCKIPSFDSTQNIIIEGNNK